ncbi:L,D-peptidoglycan transpeptidase YkuD (ErfK/YbiS/YcfS/YnhG family) [Streptomyces sp. 1114.5]|uniref:L,D-transpeptidase family protein n=1 Tax=unclassified Streptomyces TaxID=2593676 RepID=UPI000BC4BCAC|nr:MULTISPECIES: L,D-transpeptidase family protein [unclassified Streptomyces]RKT09841.1 L,D-peptidoglycan transpeptidase YkuD (ErfK/YbiS/YcfS/YnhG family) [Streptomyces sp. 1114.5]SOB88809.1 L,D-peptidoglycan transpeptidase YkuD, ErfK/YbiS/YcfS/YnhG family [Streptomyces sp. 1331.2]
MTVSPSLPATRRGSAGRCAALAVALGIAAAMTGAVPAHGTQTAEDPFPVPVALGGARQVITVRAEGTRAAVTLWDRQDGVWRSVVSTADARIGYGGLHDGLTRVQGSGTTPTGTYTLTQAFGIAPDPGTKMPYHRLTAHDWWVQDPSSAHYNHMRTDTQGGFHLTEQGPLGSEHLVDHPVQYDNVLVIDFNTTPVVKGRGAGIFLHDLGSRADATAGCVAVPAAFMTRTLRWINPTEHPVIAIG